MAIRLVKRVDNIELRWSWYAFPKEGYYSIVAWETSASSENEWCYTLASWDKDSEGVHLKFVGSRPFDSWKVDPQVFWEMARYGDSIANAEFRFDEKMAGRSITNPDSNN